MAAVPVPSTEADTQFMCIFFGPPHPIFNEDNRKVASCSVRFQLMKPELMLFDTIWFSFPRVNHW